jgi:hypothetical protein
MNVTIYFMNKQRLYKYNLPFIHISYCVYSRWFDSRLCWWSKAVISCSGNYNFFFQPPPPRHTPSTFQRIGISSHGLSWNFQRYLFTISLLTPGVSDFSAGVRTTFIYVILWGERLPNALRDVYYSTDFNELTDQTCNT